MSVDTLSTLTDLDKAKYDSRIRIKAAAEVVHPQFFTPENTVDPAHVAYFNLFDNLDSTPATRLLHITDDPTPESLSQSLVGITAYEFGNLVARMQALSATTYIKLDDAMLSLITTNLAQTLDKAAAYYVYSALTPWTGGVLAEPISPEVIMAVAASLEEDSIPRMASGLYSMIISPLTKADIFANADQTKGFIPVSKYTNATPLYNFEIGAYLGFRVVCSPNAYHATADGVRHDYPLFFGGNAFGQANGYAPEVVVTILDALKRRLNIGWKAQRGYGVVNSTAVYMLDVQPTALAAWAAA